VLRFAAVAAVALLAALALWHPAPRPALVALTPAPGTAPRRLRRPPGPPPARAVVYVVGAVRHPGLYTLASAARIDDAVRAAGGLTAQADPQAINLAARVADGDEIVAPVLGAPLPTLTRRRVRSTEPRVKASGVVVNVNDADAAMLATVPGIGATLAARIVQVRELDGPFASLDQLLDVAGMTASRLDKLRPHLTL